jgi:MoaA/NifB/PqqE/SkfB family radical SAM enzyme
LSLHEYRRLIEEAKLLGLRTVVYPGVGEPLLDSKIKELVEFSTDLGVTSVVYTCGIIDEHTLAFLRSRDVSLILKIDSLDPPTYERLVGVPFERFQESLRRILHVYHDGHQEADGRVLTRLAANTVVTRLNKHHVESIAGLCQQHGVIHFVETLSKVGAAAEHWEELVGDELPELAKIAERYGRWVSSGTIDGRCGLYAHGITVDVNGDLLACPTSRWIRLANAREHTVRELIRICVEGVHTSRPRYCLARELSLAEKDGLRNLAGGSE